MALMLELGSSRYFFRLEFYVDRVEKMTLMFPLQNPSSEYCNLTSPVYIVRAILSFLPSPTPSFAVP